MEWKPIETAPEGLILIGRQEFDDYFIHIHAAFKGSSGEWFLPFDSQNDENGQIYLEVGDEDYPTHWCALPAPPIKLK